MKASLNIGTLTGKLLVFGGVYSNLQALEALYAVAQKEAIPPENIICTGDVLGYCSQPNECVSLMREWGVHCIAGNVEENLSKGVADCGCNFDENSRCDLLSRQWYPYTQENLDEDSLIWVKQLPFHLNFQYAGKDIGVLHGSYDNISEFIFESTSWEIKTRNFEAAKADVLLAGHCGLPFSQKESDKTWLNPGVIGMPANDGTPRVWYMMLEEENGLSFSHHALEYDHVQAAKRMRLNSLPDAYADTLLDGLWDNNDILPATETRQQGIRITLADSSESPKHLSPNISTPLTSKRMAKTYYDPKDLGKFGEITDWQPELGNKFFDYYNSVFQEGELTAREKALIALAVSHVVQCPYCIDSYTKTCIKKGVEEGQMMEAIHVGAAIKSGSVLIHGVQMMRKADDMLM